MCFRWREEYSGLKIGQVGRIYRLEQENAPLKRLRVVVELGKAILRKAACAYCCARHGGAHAMPPVISATSEREVDLRPGPGCYRAVHFLAGALDDATADKIRRCLQGAEELAGLSHVFVPDGEESNVRAWASQLTVGADAIALDPGGMLRRHIQEQPGDRGPLSIVFGEDGKVVFRQSGADWGEFRAGFVRATASLVLSHYNLNPQDPVAVEGYDVVAYFTLAKATPGSKALVSIYRGVKYQFASSDHRRRFNMEPLKYVPTYGGWCASAMGDKGTKVGIDPRNFKVKDGRLFLFYKSVFADALKDWNRNERQWEPAADRNWKALAGEDPVLPSIPEHGVR
jgi:YHS domain-containing protein